MLRARDYANMEDEDLIDAIFKLAPNVNAKMIQAAHEKGLESELEEVFNRLGNTSKYYTTAQQTFAANIRPILPKVSEYDFLDVFDAEEEDASEQPDDKLVAGTTEQLQDAAIADDEASASEEEQEAAPAPTLFLYELSSKTQAKRQEIINQGYVNDRFFRMIPGKGMKSGSDSKKIYNLLVALPPFNSTPLLEKSKPRAQGNWTPQAKKVVLECLASRKFPLDGYSSRSVIIALKEYLKTHRCMPTVVYTIGNTHILCISSPTSEQPGNINLQTISDRGNLVFSDTIYGDKVSDKLTSLVSGYGGRTQMYAILRQNSKKIGTVGNTTLDQINFLRAVIEVARYSCGDHLRKLNGSQSEVFPIGIAQSRTSQLLIDDKITTSEAYGLDSSKKYYRGKMLVPEWDSATRRYEKVEAEKSEIYKAPFGVVTGKDIKNNLIEVQSKIARINEKYHDVYHAEFASATSCYMIPGNKLFRKKLAEEFGSGNESSGGDYSDEGPSAWSKQKTKLRKVPLGLG